MFPSESVEEIALKSTSNGAGPLVELAVKLATGGSLILALKSSTAPFSKKCFSLSKDGL